MQGLLLMVKNRANIWCNLMHLEKGVMGLQVRAFKHCNKWTPAYKDYWRWKGLYVKSMLVFQLKNNLPKTEIPQ